MSAADVPLRVEFEKLVATVSALSMSISGLTARLAFLESLMSVKFYDAYTDVQAGTMTSQMLFVGADRNGNNAIFHYASAYTVIVQGADGVTDAAGKTFKRFQNE